MNNSELKTLRHGEILHHKTAKNRDGTPARGRVNGKVKTWKRDSNRIRVPMKHGLYTYFYIDETNRDEWERP